MAKTQSRRIFCKNCLLASFSLFATSVFGQRNSDKGQETDCKEKMIEMIACCGLVCTDCPAFIATQTNNDQLRKSTAEKWSKMFNADIKPDDINCDGCLSNSEKLFGHCRECAIRSCCLQKQQSNCALCPEYSCQKLDDFLKFVPEARAKLEEIRSKKT